MDILTQCMQAIAAVSKKVNDVNSRLDSYINARANANQQGVADAQNATIELGMEIDARIADVENALCELSET